MKTLLVPQVALAALALAPALVAQHPASGSGLVEFTQPASAPRVRFTAAEEPPKLGVMVNETEDGVLISDVFDGSLASRAGVADGDILFKIGDSRVNAVADIPEALAAAGEGKTVSITVIRPGEGLVTLKAKQAAPKPAPQAVGEFMFAPDADGGFLGVELGEGTSDGVTIAGVIDNTAAWFAGLEDGDVLISINGDAVNTAEDVSEAIGSKSAGSHVKLVYTRNGEKQKVKARLGKRTPSMLNPMGNLSLSEFGELGGPQGLFFSKDGEDGNGFVFDHEGLSGDGGTFVIDGDFLTDGDFDWTELSDELGEWTTDGEHKLHLKLGGEHLEGLEALHELNGDHAAKLHEALKGMQLGELKELKGLKGQLKGLKGQLHSLDGKHKLKIMESLKGLENLESLKGLHVIDSLHLDDMGDGEAKTLSIKIEDGVMTIDRDGELEVIELDGENTFIEEIGFAPDNQIIKVLGNGVLGNVASINGNVIRLESSDTAAECADATVECIVVTECSDAEVECAVVLADGEQVAVDCAVECAEQVALATEVSFITAEVQAAQAEIVAVAAECAAEAAECSAAAAAECATVAAECAEAAAECADAIVECAEDAESCCSEEVSAESEETDADSIS